MDLREARSKINFLIDQTEEAVEQYFKRVEGLFEESQERIGLAMPRDSFINLGDSLENLNQRVVDLVGNHLYWTTIVPDIEKKTAWLLQLNTKKVEHIRGSLTSVVDSFTKECESLLELLTTHRKS